MWAELPHGRALHILHNPRYAGALVYGRSRTRNNPNGGTSYTRLPREQWMLLKNAHPGYIPGSSMKRIFCASAKTRKPLEQTVARVLHARVPLCCKIW